ncbi:hypothetical protein [Mesobacillus sp. S13]|uniref:hypothetical protein n=1 Tax=Mesobacillus sp. S13 TaxID=2880221 RepID=UPI001CF5ED01|nr:hypothetical protein [Mesobacillus sp. S13]
MTFYRILTEVTSGIEIGIILLLIFILILVGSAFYLVKIYKGVASPMKLSIGIAIYLVISTALSDVFLNSLLFSQGEYINYGLGEALFRLLASILVGLLIGFLITKLVYFKVVSKSLLS